MTRIDGKRGVLGALIWLLAGVASTAHAQSSVSVVATPAESRWVIDFGLGFDNGISGNINSSGIGEINNQVVVITRNSYEDVYGTGFHLRFGGGYMWDKNTEIKGTFTFQSLDADFVVPMGDIGVSNLYGQYTDYQTFGFDIGLRRYVELRPTIRGYGEGTIGIGFVDKTDVTLVAPGANLVGDLNDFYDQTTAFSFGINFGVVFDVKPKVGVFGQFGLRWMSGMTEIDDLQGTGLDDINNKSSRWTMPFVTGVQFRF